MKADAVRMDVVHTVVVDTSKMNIQSRVLLTRDFFRCYNRTQEVRNVIGLNEQIKKYMIKYDWRHIVLNIEKFTS